jgi:plasmid maintenance system antidote protein VapI
LDLVRRTLEEGNITPTRAAKILGVKPRNVGTLVSRSAA